MNKLPGFSHGARFALLGALAFAALVAMPAHAQEKKEAEGSEDMGLGLAPGSPQVGTLPGGIQPSYGQRSADEQDYRFDYHGVLIMPLRVGIGRILRRDQIPADWAVSPPNEYQSEYERQIVHLPTVAFHHLYLVGLIMIIAAGVARDHRRAVRTAGLAITIVGVVAQLLVSPQGWTG